MASDPPQLDIFGKPLEITVEEKAVLDKGTRVFLHRILHVETHAKRGDPTEPKTLVITSSRCYIMTHKPSIKLETSFNFLKIKLLECNEKKLSFHLEGETKPRELLAERKNSVTIVGLILGQLRSLFPITPIESLLKVSYSSDSISSEVSLLHETLRQAMESLDSNSLEGFIAIYGFLCDLHGIPYLEEISSYLRAVYLTHGFRELNLCDFEHFSTRDLLPLVSALRHNQYFEGLSANNIKLTPDIFEELAQTLIHSQILKKLKLNNCSVRLELLFQYCLAWKTSSKSVLTHLDLSNNPLEEKAIERFTTALESLQHGLQSLVLSNCKITAKVGAQLAQAMKKNQDLLYSLTHYDLSDNPIGPDSQAALGFIQEPQTITVLNLSKCGLNFDLVFPLLIRGCQQHLRELNLSQNKINIKKVNAANVAHNMQQFFSSAIALENVDLSDCKLTHELSVAVMEGLSVNPNIQDTKLNLSLNELNHGIDVSAMASILSRMKNVSSLDISNTGIDQHLSRLVEALGNNKTIKHLSIGQNFEGRGNAKVDGLRQLCRWVRAEDCCLESLNVADSKLKDLTTALLHALTNNDSILKLNISGNNMGAAGLRAMVKLLLSGSPLQELHYGNNDIPAVGFTYIADALEHNYTLLSLPTPVLDVARVAGKEGVGVDEALARIQSYLCRNHSDERLRIELAKRHQLRLLTTSQQSALISREIVQLEEILTNLSKSDKKPPGYDQESSQANDIKEEANKVLQLVDSLYSPHQESKQSEAIVQRIQSVMEKEVEQLYHEFVQENIEKMVTQSVKACPLFLDERTRETLRQIGSRELRMELVDAKKAVTKKTAPEIINHISGMNLETAAVISELIVDRTLGQLEGCTGRLHRMAEKTGASPSKRVSKIFSFRTRDQDNVRPNVRRRRAQDDDDSDDEVVLPSNPLATDGPTLQHLGKQRPRPVRHHHHRPAALKRNATDGHISLWEAQLTVEGDKEDKPLEPVKLDHVETPPKDKIPGEEEIPLKREEPLKPSQPSEVRESQKTPLKPPKNEQPPESNERPKTPVKPTKNEQPPESNERPKTPVKPTKNEQSSEDSEHLKTPLKPSKSNEGRESPNISQKPPKNEQSSEDNERPKTPVKTKNEEDASPLSQPDDVKKSVNSIKRKTGLSKLFGSRKEKDTKSSSTSPSSSLSPPPPTQELAHVEEKKEELLPPTKTEDVGKKRASEIVADEYIVVKNNPPVPKFKPQRPKSTEIIEEKDEGWKPPSKTSASVGQLAGVLKQGIPIQLKPTKPVIKEQEETTSTEDATDKFKETPEKKPIAPPPPVSNKPKSKRPSTKKEVPPLSPDKKDEVSENSNDVKDLDSNTLQETAKTESIEKDEKLDSNPQDEMEEKDITSTKDTTDKPKETPEKKPIGPPPVSNKPKPKRPSTKKEVLPLSIDEVSENSNDLNSSALQETAKTENIEKDEKSDSNSQDEMVKLPSADINDKDNI